MKNKILLSLCFFCFYPCLKSTIQITPNNHSVTLRITGYQLTYHGAPLANSITDLINSLNNVSVANQGRATLILNFPDVAERRYKNAFQRGANQLYSVSSFEPYLRDVEFEIRQSFQGQLTIEAEEFYPSFVSYLFGIAPHFLSD